MYTTLPPGLLFLHRRYFALALKKAPNDPLKSPFAPSVLACHRSAITLLSRLSSIHSAMPAMTQRIWFIWWVCLNCCGHFLFLSKDFESAGPMHSWPHWYVTRRRTRYMFIVLHKVLGSIVARSPGCDLAASAAPELDMACRLWETTDNVCALPVLVRVFLLSSAPGFVLTSSIRRLSASLNIRLSWHSPRRILRKVPRRMPPVV